MTLWVPEAAWDAVISEAEDKAPLETGGVLLGYFAAAASEAVVTGILGPGPNAVHRRTSFMPDADYHDRELARCYEESGRLLSYLGDWHSHPKGGGALSATDTRTLRRIARCESARAPTPLMLVAHGHREWQVTVWQVVGGVRRSIQECRVRIHA